MSRIALLKLAIPLVNTYGFTRETLSRSVLSLSTPHAEPLSETAVSSLFGDGEDARKTLLSAWMDDARGSMKSAPFATMKEVLGSRLRCNEPVLRYLPEAFALLVSPSSGMPPLDPIPVLKHVAQVADEACHVIQDAAVGPSWYARRASLAAIYAAAEFHQLTSPSTAYDFLESLLHTSDQVESSLSEVNLFANYVGRSWIGIIQSRGIF